MLMVELPGHGGGGGGVRERHRGSHLYPRVLHRDCRDTEDGVGDGRRDDDNGDGDSGDDDERGNPVVALSMATATTAAEAEWAPAPTESLAAPNKGGGGSSGGSDGPTLSSPKPPLPSSPPLPPPLPLHNDEIFGDRGRKVPGPAARLGFKEASGGGSGSGDAGGYVPWGVGGVGLAAEAVCAVCDAVGAGPYLIVGYSMGGRVALELAQRRPRLVERGGGLVLVSSSPGLTR